MSRAFTLLELIVAVAIVLVLMSLMLPVFDRAYRTAHETTTRSNLRQAWLALALYRESEGDLPQTEASAKAATGMIPVCQSGNPWDPAGPVMPPPTVGQFGYVRLVARFQRRESWEAAFPEGHRPLLATFRFSEPLPPRFEGDEPSDRLQFNPVRPEWWMPRQIMGVDDDGALIDLHRSTRRSYWTLGIHQGVHAGHIYMSWPQLFLHLGARRP